MNLIDYFRFIEQFEFRKTSKENNKNYWIKAQRKEWCAKKDSIEKGMVFGHYNFLALETNLLRIKFKGLFVYTIPSATLKKSGAKNKLP